MCAPQSIALSQPSTRNGSFSRDANYNVTAVFDTSGNVQQRQVYDPYGRVDFKAENWSATTDSFSTKHLWQGGWRDASTGLYHFNARWYNPTHMRWISADPEHIVTHYVGNLGADYDFEAMGLDPTADHISLHTPMELPVGWIVSHWRGLP